MRLSVNFLEETLQAKKERNDIASRPELALVNAN